MSELMKKKYLAEFMVGLRGIAGGYTRYSSIPYQMVVSHNLAHAFKIIDTETDPGDGFESVSEFYGSNPIAMYVTGTSIVDCINQLDKKARAIKAVGEYDWDILMDEVAAEFNKHVANYQQGSMSKDLRKRCDEFAEKMKAFLTALEGE